MGHPTFRFTLQHAQLGTKIISEPDGWKNAKLKLERHPEFHSLVEYFEGSFIFYGNNGQVDGGINFIKNVENVYGFDAELKIFIDISFDDGIDFENIYTGQLDLSTLQELKNNKLSCAIVRNNLWSRLINKFKTPVNCKSSTDLYGNSVVTSGDHTLSLTPQKVRLVHHSKASSYTLMDVPTASEYFQVDWDKKILEELNTKYNLPVAINPDIPVEIFTPEYDGSYAFDIQFFITRYEVGATNKFTDPDGTAGIDNVSFAFQINDDIPITFSEDLAAPIGYVRKFYYTATHTLIKGDFIKVFGVSDATGLNTNAFVFLGADQTGINAAMPAPPTALFEFPESQVYDSYFKITADTEYEESTASSFFVYNAGHNILNRILGSSGRFYSAFFGGANSVVTYSPNGCGYAFDLVKGLQVRSYTLSEKPFFMSLEQWWNGLNPIFNLGLGYEIISGQEKIRVEEKASFYDRSSTPSVYIDNVREMIREYDKERIFNKIEIGYQKWESGEITGLDDIQTKRTYATKIEKVDNGITLFSEFIGSPLALEIARRKTKEKNKDYKFDNDTFIVAINPTAVGGNYIPELDENFTIVGGIVNGDTRYNLRIGAVRNFLRWANYFNGCVQTYLTSIFKFVSGEGNFSASTTMVTNGCRGDGEDMGQFYPFFPDAISEGQDIRVTSDYIHLPHLYSIEIDLSWDDYTAIRANRKKAIAISQTTTGHKKFFIKELEYEICRSKCKMEVWPAEPFQIEVIS